MNFIQNRVFFMNDLFFNQSNLDENIFKNLIDHLQIANNSNYDDFAGTNSTNWKPTVDYIRTKRTDQRFGAIYR